MDFIQVKDPSGVGSWLLILGCPREASHQLRDEARHLSGPTFAACAECAYQVGSHFENRDPDLDWSLGAFPEQLQCGYGEGAGESQEAEGAPNVQSSWKAG